MTPNPLCCTYLYDVQGIPRCFYSFQACEDILLAEETNDFSAIPGPHDHLNFGSSADKRMLELEDQVNFEKMTQDLSAIESVTQEDVSDACSELITQVHYLHLSFFFHVTLPVHG